MKTLVVMSMVMVVGFTFIGIYMFFKERSDWRELEKKSKLSEIENLSD